MENINSLIGDLNGAFEDFKRDHRSEVDAIRSELDQIAVGRSSVRSGSNARPSLGASVVKEAGESPAYAALREWNTGSARFNFDASLRAAMGNEDQPPVGGTFYPSQPEHRKDAVLPIMRPLRLLDVLPSRKTESDSVKFVQLNATGDAAEQINEGDEKDEIVFDGVLKSANVVTIAGHTTASRQVLEDINTLRAQVDQVMAHKVRSRLEDQLINGPGGQGRINGLLSQAAAFTPAIGTTDADMVGEALVTMADAGYSPGLVLMNPLDWFRIQLTRTTDDEYTFGSPTMPVPPSLWNTRIVTTPSVPARSVLTADTSFTTVLDRNKVSVFVSNSHKDYFSRNLLMILCEMRAGLEVLDVNAVRKITLPAIV